MLHFNKLFLIPLFLFCTFVVFAQPRFFANPYFLGVYKKGPSFGGGISVGVIKNNKHIFYFDFGNSRLKLAGKKNAAIPYSYTYKFADIMFGYNFCFKINKKNNLLLGALYGGASASIFKEIELSPTNIRQFKNYDNGPLSFALKASYNHQIAKHVYFSVANVFIVNMRYQSIGLFSQQRIPHSENTTPTLQIGLLFQ